MSDKYKFTDKEGIYFITGTTVGWTDVFTRNIYRDIWVDSVKYCQKNQGLQVHAWVLMTNHFHMICSFANENDPGMVIKNTKSFTAINLIEAIINNPRESRKDWLLKLFEQYGAQNKNNYRYQFWQHENHPVLLNNVSMFNQRLKYLHENPVRAGFVLSPEYWQYSSAIDYYVINGKRLLDLILLE